MCSGVLLHRFATIDEYDLHGRGREIPFVGVLMAIGALLLAGVPPFTAFAGKSLVEGASSQTDYAWLAVVFVIVSALTGGAVLRVTGRVFLGSGPSEGPDPSQARAAEERVDEEHGPPRAHAHDDDRRPCGIAGPCCCSRPRPRRNPRGRAGRRSVRGSRCVRAVGTRVRARELAGDVCNPLAGLGCALRPAGPGAGQIAAAALGLFGRPLRESFPRGLQNTTRDALRGLRHLDSGHIGDYIAWWTAGASALGAVCLLALT